MKSPTLYHDSLSYPCQFVRLALAEKNVRAKRRKLDESRGGHLKPRHLAINENGELPLFEHNGIVLSDIVTICLYVNNNFPGPMLVPTDAETRDAMESWIRLAQQFPDHELFINPTASKRGRRARARLVRQRNCAKHFAAKYPEYEKIYKRTAQTLQKQLSRSSNKKFVERSQTRVEEMLDELERGLKGKTWLAGTAYSLADVAWTVLLARLDYCGQSGAWTRGRRPNVEAYYERVKKRASFHKANVIRKPPVFGPVEQFVRLHWGVLTVGGIGAAIGGYMLLQI